MTLSAEVLRDDSLRAAPAGFELLVRLNWYRALPLSCVETLDVVFDGKPVSREAITFRLNGREFALDDLSAQHDEWWYVLDPATVAVAGDSAVQPGEAHDVGLTLACRAPYIMLGDKALVVANSYEERLVAR